MCLIMFTDIAGATVPTLHMLCGGTTKVNVYKLCTLCMLLGKSLVD